MAHPVMWFEVLGNDGGKLRRFYGDLFGWTFDVLPQIDYGVATTGDARGIMGGIGPTYPGTRPWVTFYTETPDVILGVFEDPEGHVLGLVEARAAAAQ